MSPKKYFSYIVIIGTLSAIGPFSIDMYLPGFQAIAEDLHTTVAKVSLSLSSFFIGISAGQLLYGPLLDRFGRKKPLYYGLTLYVLASVGCSLASTPEMLIEMRFLQAIGGCSGMVAARALVRDLFPVHENAKVFSLLMLVIGVSPIIAPTLGGYVTYHFGWHYMFIILALLGAGILAGVHFVLPEGMKPNLSLSLKPRPIIRSYVGVFKNPQFYTYVFAGSMASAGLYAYISGSPFVFLELFKVSATQYGWIFTIIAIGLITSSQLNTYLLKRGLKSEVIVIGALIGQSVTGVLFFIAACNQWLGVVSSVSFIFLFLCCQGFVFPNTSALALAPFSKNAGTASALMGALQMSIGALVSAMVSVVNDGTARPMSGMMGACAITGLAFLLIGGRIVRNRASVAAVEEEEAEMITTF